MYKKAICLLCSMSLFICLSVTVFANSGLSYWSGQSGSELVSKDQDSPLQVKNEVLTFDLREFPQSHYSNIDEFINYSGKVTARYTIHNPSNEKIKATLSFPFGALPAYDFGADFDFNEISSRYNEAYKISVNGSEIEKNLRHTFSYGFGTFDYKDDIKKISDNFKKDDFFSPNMPVKVYVFEASGISDEISESAYASALFSVDADKTRILLADCSGYEQKDYKTVDAELYVENGISFTMYVIGEDIKKAPEWTVYSDISQEVETDAEVKLLFTDNWKFKDVALMFHSSDSGVSEMDWYNAAVDKLNNLSFYTGFLGPDTELMLSDCLMQWFEYEIELDAGETITNTVTAPIYPDINNNFNPYIFSYNYLLSPAKTFKEFGEIDVIINTPYYLTESSGAEFERTQNGYTATLSTLPDDELYFSLSESKNPRLPLSTYQIMNIAVLSAVALLLILNIILIILLIRKTKK